MNKYINERYDINIIGKKWLDKINELYSSFKLFSLLLIC